MSRAACVTERRPLLLRLHAAARPAQESIRGGFGDQPSCLRHQLARFGDEFGKHETIAVHPVIRHGALPVLQAGARFGLSATSAYGQSLSR